MKILVTGAAGFIGFHTSLRLLARGDEVVGFDNLNPYYDVRLKEARLDQLTPNRAFRFIRGELADSKSMAEMFRSERFDSVVHLAAQAGVRYSLKNPHAYIDSNLIGFTNILGWADPERRLGVAILNSGKPVVSLGFIPLMNLVMQVSRTFRKT